MFELAFVKTKYKSGLIKKYSPYFISTHTACTHTTQMLDILVFF